jgi:hypothetical protein
MAQHSRDAFRSHVTNGSFSTDAPQRRGSIAFLLPMLLLASRPALAQETYPPPVLAPPEKPADAPTFGGPGQWFILSSSTSASLTSETFSGSEANFFNASIGIGVDLFVLRNVSIGIDAEASYGDGKGYGASTFNETVSNHFAGGLRLGVNLPLGHLLSFYPRVTIGAQSERSDTHTITAYTNYFPPSSSTSRVGAWVNFYAPLLVHLAPHFFVGVGPRVGRDFGTYSGGPYDGSQTTLLSAEVAIGGWWGGPAEVAPNGDAQSHEPLFGERGQFVLTGATTASVSSSSYSASNASSWGVTVEPALDYFVVRHVSLGGSVSIATSGGSSYDSSQTRTDFYSQSLGVAPRIGLDIPLVSGILSVWPMVEVGAGSASSSQTSVGGTNQHTKGRVWVTASAPLLVHVATHLFLGAGPFVFHELVDSDQNQVENDATTVGANFVMGGWL